MDQHSLIQSAVEGDSLNQKLNSDMHLVFRTLALFHAHFLVVSMQPIQKTACFTIGRTLCCHWIPTNHPVSNFDFTFLLHRSTMNQCIILTDKWTIFCMLFNFKIYFVNNINLLLHHYIFYVHVRNSYNFDKILCLDSLYIILVIVVTCHRKYATKIWRSTSHHTNYDSDPKSPTTKKIWTKDRCSKNMNVSVTVKILLYVPVRVLLLSNQVTHTALIRLVQLAAGA
jgi:hypothetical protein